MKSKIDSHSRIGKWSDVILKSRPELNLAKRAVENELMAMSTINIAYNLEFLPQGAVFIGGTALRLVHGSPRFSQDLNFHLPMGEVKGIDDQALVRDLETFIGAKVHASVNVDTSRARLLRLSAKLPERTRDMSWPRTGIDMAPGIVLDAVPSVVALRMAGGTIPGMRDLGPPFIMKVSTR